MYRQESGFCNNLGASKYRKTQCTCRINDVTIAVAVCRNALAGTLSGMPRQDIILEREAVIGNKEGEDSSIGSAGSLAKRNQADLSWEHDEVGTSDGKVQYIILKHMLYK